MPPSLFSSTSNALHSTGAYVESYREDHASLSMHFAEDWRKDVGRFCLVRRRRRERFPAECKRQRKCSITSYWSSFHRYKKKRDNLRQVEKATSFVWPIAPSCSPSHCERRIPQTDDRWKRDENESNEIVRQHDGGGCHEGNVRH